MDIPQRRLANQHLTGKKFKSAAEAIGWLGALQAQDYAAAKWALGMRVAGSTDQSIEKAYDEGSILRTHVLRPTWHFVLPADIRWMEKLTAPRVKTFMATYNRKLELTDAVFAKAHTIITKALAHGNYLTRQELRKLLADAGIPTDVQRLAHIVMWAELDALICSGPRRGKQFTYALLDERVPKTKIISREESLQKLALTYFTSHGPAQLGDFSWWSGLTMKDAQMGLETASGKLISEIIGGKTYWFRPYIKEATLPGSKQAFFLSIFDEYIIAYKDRSALGGDRYAEKFLAMGNALTAVVVFEGAIIGTWKREIGSKQVVVRVKSFVHFSSSQQEAFESEAVRYGVFLGMPVICEFSRS